MRKIKIIIGVFFIFIWIAKISNADDPFPFQAESIADEINIRSDSTVNSPVICNIKKGESLEVISEAYEWYKIRLPKYVPAFVKKNLIIKIDDKTAKVKADKVNIRLGPDVSFPIIGKANKEELVTIVGESEEWYKIKPLDSCYGWIHKKFVKKIIPVIVEVVVQPEIKETQEAEEVKPIEEETRLAIEEQTAVLVIEGLLKPKVIKNIATHKLITDQKKIFLLKGDPEVFETMDYLKVRVNARLIEEKSNYTLVEVLKIERL
ncbi:MAG: SH3 domain-containing protein [Candidatus Omnitrophica bacterium]|nr:SH3 domain-containing protein [Candidatus Omnitrophota bacterium]